MFEHPVPGELGLVLKADNYPEIERTVVLVTGWDKYASESEETKQYAPWVYIDVPLPAGINPNHFDGVNIPQRYLMKITPGDIIEDELWTEQKVIDRIRQIQEQSKNELVES